MLVTALKEAGFRVLTVTADTPTQERVERAWELTNGYDVLVASTNCLNRGVTITEANHVIIANLEWSPEVTEQAEDRVHRPGQTKEVHIHYVMTANSVDGKMLDLVEPEVGGLALGARPGSARHRRGRPPGADRRRERHDASRQGDPGRS